MAKMRLSVGKIGLGRIMDFRKERLKWHDDVS
jgi:hypothetical protein